MVRKKEIVKKVVKKESKIEIAKTKPVVNAVGHWAIETCENVSVCMFFEVVTNHPRLGSCHDVQTSRVLNVDFEKGICETMNTIYHFETLV